MYDDRIQVHVVCSSCSTKCKDYNECICNILLEFICDTIQKTFLRTLVCRLGRFVGPHLGFDPPSSQMCLLLMSLVNYRPLLQKCSLTKLR